MTRTSFAFAAAVFAPMLDAGSAAAQSAPNMTDEIAIVRIVDGLDSAVDGRDWNRARHYLADNIRADFSSLSGQPAATIPSDDLVGAWSSNLKGSKTSFHMRTNHQIEITGDRAEVKSVGYAWNRMEGNGEPLWEVWGFYEHTLTRAADGWKVDGMTLRVTHERGNQWVKATPGS